MRVCSGFLHQTVSFFLSSSRLASIRTAWWLVGEDTNYATALTFLVSFLACGGLKELDYGLFLSLYEISFWLIGEWASMGFRAWA